MAIFTTNLGTGLTFCELMFPIDATAKNVAVMYLFIIVLFTNNVIYASYQQR